MPSIERDAPRDQDRPMKHQHAASIDVGRALVPMWDSSDPERAPPPLPLNPQSPGVSRTGTSSAIQSAHAAMAEKARENAALVPHLPKRVDASPERSGLRPSSHRRMQSLQPASVKDMSFMLESASGRESPQSVPRSPEKMDRPSTPQRRDTRDVFVEPRDERQDRSATSTPVPGPSLTPIIRPTALRRPQSSILGENAPPQSATMLALQNMSTQAISSSSNSAPVSPLKEPENPLANITNGSKALVKPPGSLDSLSSQILSLTDIATTLQKEMSLLSRRSRDNATDLLSLKEATNTRDEDIRKSLRELMAEAKARAANNTRDPYGGPLLLEGRHPPSSPTLSKTARPFSLPRIPSPNSFAASFDRESLLSTPSLVSDAPPAATSGLLDKIMRDMGTREGQEMLLGRLAELADRLSGMASAAKVEELLRFLKSNQQQAVVPRAGGADGSNRGRNWSFDEDDTISRRSALDYLQAASASQSSRILPRQDTRSTRSADGLGDDVLQAIRSVKDSVAQGGGLTAETKALVRELRGEVLGMGREIGRRLDEVAEQSPGGAEGVTKAEMARVVEEGLSEMSQQMNSLLREHRRQSTGTASPRESSIDYKEIYNSVRAALKDTQATKPRSPELRREDVVQAVKDAWEKYKPEIEIQQIGLERDEVLACLQEGLRAYAPRDDRPPGATRDEVFQAVTDGLKHYVPPKVEIPPALSRDEILDAVRECLEEFEFPVAPGMGSDFTREDMLDAVKEGLHSFDFPTPPAPAPVSQVTRSDVLDAVTQGLHSFDFSTVNSNALVPQSVSKGDVSDAVKSGLKSLDLSSDILDAVKEGLESSDLPTNVLQVVMQGIQSFDFAAAIPRPDLSRVDVADAVKEGIESLDFNNSVTNAVKQALKGFDFSSAHSAHSSSALVPHSDVSRALPTNNEDVADAVKEGLKSVDLSKDVSEAVRKALEAFDFSVVSSAVVSQPEFSRGDVVSAVKEGLDTAHLSKDVAHAVQEVLESFEFPSSSAAVAASSGPDLSRGDVVDAVKEGLDSLDLSTGLGDAVKKELNAFDFSAIQSTALAAPGSGNSDDVMQRLQEIKELLQGEIKAASEETKQNIAANALGTEQVLDATKDGFEKLRQEMEDYVDRAKSDSGSEQAVDQLLDTLDGFREDLTELITRSSDNSRTFLKGEVDSIRDIVNSSMVPAAPQQLNNKELIEALQEGLQGLRSEISSRPIAGLTEILDALQEGLGDIRTSLNNLRDKPADLTANDEILEALKEGLESLRSDIDSLREEKQNDRALATISNDTKAIESTEQMLKHDDIKNLEALITQLGIKVEALESTPKPEVSSLSKEDLAEMEKVLRDVTASVSNMPNREPLEALEESIRKIQETVDDLASKGPAPLPRSSTDAASREDVEAIETILRNTKGRLDDLMDGEQAIRKDHIDGLETLILEARESVNGLSSQFDVISRKEHIDALGSLLDDTRQSLGGLATQMDNLSRKEDVALVESLVNQVVAAFDEMKERHEKALEDPEKITKTDVEAVEAVCLDTKSLVEHIQKVDLVNLPSKEDLESLELRLGDVKDKLDAQADANIKGFEERQAEIVGVSVAVTEVKTALDEFQSLVRSKFEDGGRGIDSIHTILDALGESVRKNDNISDDVKELLDTVKLEFEDSKTGLVGVKLELDEKLQSAAESMLAKLDERMAELMTKHEELQLTQDERAAKGEERDSGMEAAMIETKTIAEELKSLVDTLGGAVTESMEKVEESSKTVFERVDELVTKSDDNHADNKVEHQLTREQVQEAIGKVDGLHGQVSEYQPKILESVQEVMMALSQHYENLKTSTLAIQERVENPLLPPPPEKYDDTVVHEKLDTLVGHTLVAGKAFEQLDTLDQVHAQVKATAAELAAFLAAQTQRIADEHEDREKTLQETTITLERRREEIDQVEALLATLRDEEARLKEAITVTLPEEQSKINEQFLSNMISEEFRLKEATTTLIDEQARLKETFLAALHDEQAPRIMETNVALKEEQEQLKETFLASLKDEQARLMESNVALKGEQDALKEEFLASLREEEGRLKGINEALREEHQNLKDAFLANLHDEAALLKESNAHIREEQERLRESFAATFKEEEQRLREANEALRLEQEQMKTTLKEEQERFKVELLANLMEEETHLKEANAALREEQELLRADFLATLKEDESRIKDSLEALRSEQEGLSRQKTRLNAELSSLDTALRLRREELHDMEARAESLERRILEGVMDHSRVLLMAKTNRGNVNSTRDTMSRKRVTSSQRSAQATPEANGNSSGTANNSKSRSAINMAMSARSKANTPNGAPASSNRRILSLSQITNNVPSGGMKRSQSVRTAGGAAAARGLRKSTWAPPVPALPVGAAKGYGDLKAAGGDGMGEDDKENAGMGHRLHEGEEDAYHEHQQRDVSSSKPPVDIVISEPTITTTSEPDIVNISVTPSSVTESGEHQTPRGDETEDDEQNFLDAEEDRFSDLGEDAVDMDGEDEEGDARNLRSLRRSSHGTTVITPADEEGREEERKGDGDIDDAASDWTESVVGRESEGSVDAGGDDPVGVIETGVPVAAAS
ncbi:uncharacterized protein C8A04DRAFT_12918 [Dichotomopilus funicola]|uniref:Transport protein USO1 n=1 Tax=Dichotomopilus funicola TaxID=1934379 RepID=A0AAN6ZMM6_9PEZI|nr:hypothetical protein C8A04DRAFT_12918 [Dichotomopilus funicola]